MLSKKALKMDKKDNVATLTSNADAGDFVEVISKTGNVETRLKARDQIPFGHKVSLASIEKNGEIIKYGRIIGVSSESIKIGEHVHVHNVKSLKVR